MFQKTATSHSNLISWLMRSQCRIPWNRGTGVDKWKPCQGPDSEWTEIIECENAFLQNRGSLMWAAGWLEWIVHSWRTINHVLNCQFSCLSVLRLRRSGGGRRKSDQKIEFCQIGISFVYTLLLNLLLTRVLCMPFGQSIQVLIWSWKARWHLHLHLHCDCDAAEMGTLHAPPCPLTCLTGGVGDNPGWGLLPQTITSLKVVSRPEFRG